MRVEAGRSLAGSGVGERSPRGPEPSAGGRALGIAALAGIDVTVPKQRRPAAGIAQHVTAVAPDEITYRDAIPLTTVPRNLFDLATLLRPRQLERAMNEAETKRLTDSLSLRDLLVRYPRRPGPAPSAPCSRRGKPV
jgi:hypothetical protein